MTVDEQDDVRQEIIGTVRRFVAREVAPVAAVLEREDRYPDEIVEQMKALGLFGVTIPEAYGGLGLDLLTYIGVIEELAYGWMSLTGVVNTHTMAATLILAARHRRPEGSVAAVHGLGRAPGRALPVRARCRQRHPQHLLPGARDGEEFVVNGTKAWVTNGERASVVALAARTDEGISALIVEKEPGPAFEGISVSRHVGKLGYRGVETVDMAYVDHRVPVANLVGEPGRGLAQILSVLELGRINIAARAVGVARAAFDAAFALRPAAGHVRQADRGAPGDPAQDRRHGDAARGGPPADPQRRRAQDGRAALRRRSRHGQAVRQRDRARAGHRGHADPRWRRLHDRHSRSSATTATPR